MPDTLTRSLPVPEAARQYWLDQLTVIRAKVTSLLVEGRLSQSVPGGHSGQDIRVAEEVHDLRVAVRRCQSTAKALAVYVPEIWPRQICQVLKPLRKACDCVRDLDVLLTWLKDQPAAHLATAGLLDVVQHEHDCAYENLLETLSSRKSQKAPGKIEKLLQRDAGQTADFLKPAPNRASRPIYLVKDIVAPVLLARAAQMTVYLDRLVSSPDEHTFECALHQWRIAGKDFRYTLEMFMPALRPESAELREQFRQLQDQVGEFHDEIKFARLLEELRTQANLPGELIDEWLHILAGLKHEQWPKIEENVRRMNPKWFAEEIAQILAEGD